MQYVEQHELDRHGKDKHEVVCSICSLILYDEYDLKTHEMEHTIAANIKQVEDKTSKMAEDLKQFFCLTCDYTSGKESLLEGHVKDNHKKCFECGEILMNLYKLEMHTETQHKVDTQTLQNMMYITMAELVCPCDQCGYTALSPSLLNDHVLNTHCKQNEITSEQVETTSEVTPEIYQASHQQIHDPLIKCDNCAFETKDANVMRIHKAEHTKSLYCDQCSFKATSEFAFNLHSHSNSPAKKTERFTCSFCGVVFGENSDLVLHYSISTDGTGVRLTPFHRN